MEHDDDADARELFSKCAAIMEIDGGLPRYRAEFYAAVATFLHCERTGLQPPRTAYYRELAKGFLRSRPRIFDGQLEGW